MMNKYSLIFEMCHCKKHNLYDNNLVEKLFTNMLISSGFTVIETMKHDFKPQGLTFVAILSESHALIHSYPEENRLSIDIYTCSNPGKIENFIELATHEFEPGKYFFKVLDRNRLVDE